MCTGSSSSGPTRPHRRSGLRALVVLVVALLASGPTFLLAEPVPPPATGPARAIVKFKPGSASSKQSPSTTPRSAARASILGKRLDVAIADGPALSDDTQVVLSHGMSSAELAQRLLLDGVSQAKSITRLLFAPPAGTLCRQGG